MKRGSHQQERKALPLWFKKIIHAKLHASRNQSLQARFKKNMNEKNSHNHSTEKKHNGHSYPAFSGGDLSDHVDEEKAEYEDSSILTNEIDHHIIMHRDAHFGGDFAVMLAYYEDEKRIGIHPDFDWERIAYLAEVEKEMGEDLAPLLLTGVEAEAIGKARSCYSQLKEIYEIDHEKNPYPRLIADLILSENDEQEKETRYLTQKVAEAIISQGSAIVPYLIDLVKSDEFYASLFPGYGYAPYFAIYCLGCIKDSRAIIPLFETLSRPFMFDEMVIIGALSLIGEPAKEFLLKILKSRPLTQDNFNAAHALIAFPEEPAVAVACFEQLLDPAVQKQPLFCMYLLCSCHILNETPYREAFIELSDNLNIPSALCTDMQQIINEWNV